VSDPLTLDEVEHVARMKMLAQRQIDIGESQRWAAAGEVLLLVGYIEKLRASRAPRPLAPPDLAQIADAFIEEAWDKPLRGEAFRERLIAALLSARPPAPERERAKALIDEVARWGSTGLPVEAEAKEAALSAFDALAAERDAAAKLAGIPAWRAEVLARDERRMKEAEALADSLASRVESAERALGEARRTLTEWAEADDDAGPLDDPRSPQGIRLRIAKERLHSLAAASPGPDPVRARCREIADQLEQAMRGPGVLVIPLREAIRDLRSMSPAAPPGTPTGAGPHLACFNCGLEHGPEFPQEPTVQPRPDGKTRCNDCERKRLCSHPAGFTRDGRKFCVRCGENMPKPAPESPGSAALNQCDGCRRGLPLRDGTHYGEGYDAIGCTAHLYRASPGSATDPEAP
jgi:hypothetical protein